MLEREHILFLGPWPAIVPKFDRTGDQHLKMAPTERRERCPLCAALEPRQDNGASGKRAKFFFFFSQNKFLEENKRAEV